MRLGPARTRAVNVFAWAATAVVGLALLQAVEATGAPVGARGACTIVGTPGPDVLVGTRGRDVICGFGGDDRLIGNGGDDVLRGGDGDDVLIGGAGNDVLWGGAGDDVLRGGDGDDLLRGGGGDDILYGERGDDGLRGGFGDDRIFGGPGRDRLFGKGGNDRLAGGPGRDRLSCGPGDDTTVGTRGDVVAKDCRPGRPRKPPTPPTPPNPPVVPSAPVAVADTVSATEDTVLELPVSGSGSPAANDTDADGDPLSVTAVSAATGGTVAIVGTTIRFTPDADLCGPAAGGFDYTVSDGTGRTATGRVTVDIDCVDDDPVAQDDDATVVEDVAATALDVLANDGDADGDALEIDSVTQPAHGTVVVTGAGSGLTYAPDADYCNTPPGTTLDTFTYTLTPGGSTATVSVTVTCVDDAPVAVDDAAGVEEDSGATPVDVLANDTDVDGGPLTIASATQPAHGTVVITGGGSGLTYEPDADYCNDQPGAAADTFDYALNGGSTATVTMTVECVDDPPVAVDDAASVEEDSGATAVDVLDNDLPGDGVLVVGSVTQPVHGTVVITGGGSGLTYEPDADYCNAPPGTALATFTYTLASGGAPATVAVTVTCVDDPPVAADDSATVEEDAAATAIDVLANDVDVEGDAISITSVTQPVNGAVVVTGGGTGLTYQPAADFCTTNPGGTPDTFTYTIDGGSTATVFVTVTCVNDLAVARDDDMTVDEDVLAVLGVLANDTEGDEPLRVTAVTQPAHGTVAIRPDGLGVSYLGAADYCNTPPGTALDTFTYTVTGGDTAEVRVTVRCVNDAPAAADVTFDGTRSAVGNTTLVVDAPGDGAPGVSGPHKSVTGDLLAGATDVEGATLAVVPGTITTTLGGSVTLQADGDFVYLPPAGCSGTSDSFDYRVTDQHASDPQTGEGTVTLARAECVWYVSNDAPGDAGTAAAPFDTLARAQNASGAGHTIYVFSGDGTTTGYSAGITLKSGQRLLGELVDLQVGGTVLAPGVPDARPLLSATGTDVVTLATGNVVAGLQIDPSGAGSAIAGGAGVNGGTLRNLRLLDLGTAGTQPMLELVGTTGSFAVSDLVVGNEAAQGTTSGSVGVLLSSAGTVVFDAQSTIRIATAGARALSVTSTGLGASQFDRISVQGSVSGGIELVSTTGTPSFDELGVHTSGGSAPAFRLQGAPGVTLAGDGYRDVQASGGPAVEVSASAGSTLAFNEAWSSGSTGRGIWLAGLGTGTFSASGGAIDGHTGTAFDVDGGSGNITYGGQIGDGTGSSVRVTARTGGTVTLGSITDGSDAGGGVSVTGNTGGTTVLGGGTTLVTGASDAIAFTNSDGHTLRIPDAPLTVTTTTGDGIEATNSGTLVVTGSQNTLTSAGGRALVVTNTDIGAGGLTFRRITATGGPNGIVLSGTGTSGSLQVTGDGGTCTAASTAGCSGGVVSGTTGGDDAGTTPVGTGVVLHDTQAPSLTRMWIHDHSNYGIRGLAVRGLALTDSVVNGANGDSEVTDEASIALSNLSGSASITRTHVGGGFEDNLRVRNTTGSLDRLTLDTVTFATSGNRPSNDALALESETGAADFKVTVTGATIPAAGGDLLQFSHNGSGKGDLQVTDSTLSNSHPAVTTGGGGVSLFQGGSAGGTTMSLTGNSFRGAVGTGVLIGKGNGPSRQLGTFGANTIGVSGAPNSGSVEGSALKLQLLGGGSMAWTVDGNQIRGYNNHGIEVQAGGGGVASGGILNTVVTGNVIAEPGTAPGSAGLLKQAIHYNVGTFAGDTFDVCAAIAINDLASGGADTTPPSGTFYDVRLRQRQLTTVRLPGYGGAANDDAAVQAYVAAQNPTGGPTVSTTQSVASGGSGFRGTTCTAVPAP